MYRTDELAVQGLGMLRAKNQVAVESSRVEVRVRVVHGCDDFALMILQMQCDPCGVLADRLASLGM